MIRIAVSVKFRAFGITFGTVSKTWNVQIASVLGFVPLHEQYQGITIDVSAVDVTTGRTITHPSSPA